MSNEINILTVGFHKGEMDFGINGSIQELSREEMNQFREMVCVAIGTAEDMWRRSNCENAEECAAYKVVE